MQLKVIQEVVTLSIFALITIFIFGGETFRWNHLAATLCLIMAVWFVFMD